jgi:hypothetical protein
MKTGQAPPPEGQLTLMSNVKHRRHDGAFSTRTSAKLIR